MIGLIFTVFVITDVVLIWLWLAGVNAEVGRFRAELDGSWAQLRAAIFARREVMPYLIASVNIHEPEAVEAIGNACDLASPAAGIGEQARAEARLNAALKRLIGLVAEHPEWRTNETFARLREDLKGHDARVSFLAEAYNKQVKAFNLRLESAAARVLGLFMTLKKAEEFPEER